jgi:hypothetical protein
VIASVAQLIGYLMAVAGAFLLFGPWALVAGGLVLLLVPEIVEVARRGTAASPPRTREPR